MSPQSGSTQPCRRLFIAAVPDIRHVHQTNGEASMSENSAAFVSLSADVVAAYVSNNSVTQSDLPALIASVHGALRDAANGKQQAEKVVLEPPVSIKKSMSASHLISMEDGRPYKSLKRHLTARGLTPAQYREKWSLPLDYPMVAPNYSKARSELAKAIGLGQTRKGKKAGKKRAG
jgi:predicted transcriptional regulator